MGLESTCLQKAFQLLKEGRIKWRVLVSALNWIEPLTALLQKYNMPVL